jgi:hypothetical protein
MSATCTEDHSPPRAVSLADAIYKKFYSDMPRTEFDAKLFGKTRQQSSTGMFDDLIPQQSGGMFDDLIPARQPLTATDLFDDLIPQQSGGMFDDLIPARQPLTATDVAKSAGIGVVKGGIGLLGAPADLGEIGARGLDAAVKYVGGKLGIDPTALERRQGPPFDATTRPAVLV